MTVKTTTVYQALATWSNIADAKELLHKLINAKVAAYINIAETRVTHATYVRVMVRDDQLTTAKVVMGEVPEQIVGD